jgi:hypothetical protein
MKTWIVLVAVCAVSTGAAAYLRDPPWAMRVTSGLREWEEDPPGTRFRWTAGRGSFFVPAAAATMTVPMRAVFPGPGGQPVVVSVSVDDRWLADVELTDPDAWVRAPLPLPRKATTRRFRRVDLHVSRTAVGAFVLGIMTGEIDLTY